MSKINRLILEWSKGTVKSARELSEAGYSPQILKGYVNSGWITLLSRGAYKLADEDLEWQGGLYCLQRDPNNTIHVGAKTALSLKGYSHYISWNEGSIELFGGVKEKLPRWFSKQPWMQKIKLFRTEVFPYEYPRILSTVDVNNVPIKISASELAMLEMVFLVPTVHPFNEVKLTMESLTALRSELLQVLLEDCSSVNTKRLFLYLAEIYNHSWFQELNLTKVNLGSGKREIVKNGKLDKKYKITVPKDHEE